MTTLGEMHVRRGHYIGVAPVPGGLTNACLVVPHRIAVTLRRSPTPADSRSTGTLRRPIPRSVGSRFRARARARVAPPAMLGPMAVDASAAGEPGLLLAGDAAGFIDPMTGDGLRFALMGAELAAAIVHEVLDGTLPIDRAHLELAARRRAAFQAKWRFNRALRSLVSSPASVSAAAVTARVLAVAVRTDDSLRR